MRASSLWIGVVYMFYGCGLRVFQAATDHAPGVYEKKRAEMLAGLGYNVLAVDIYGKGVRPDNPRDAGAEAGKYKDNRSLLRARVRTGLARAGPPDRVGKGLSERDTPLLPVPAQGRVLNCRSGQTREVPQGSRRTPSRLETGCLRPSIALG